MNLRDLRAFVAVAEELSFTRAAERLHIAQSPLSQQIRRVESSLGVPLFERTTRSVTLTTAGQMLLDRLRPALNATEQALTLASRVGTGGRGVLAVGLTASATYRYLPRILERFDSRDSGLSLELHPEMFTSQQVELLSSGVLSVALLRPPVRGAGITVETLTKEPLVVVLPASHPLAESQDVRWAQLRDEVFIGYPPEPVSTIQTRIVHACIDAGFMPNMRHTVTNSATIISMVRSGTGIGVVPESMRSLQLDGVVFRPLTDPEVSLELSLAYHEGTTDPGVRVFADVVRSVIG